MSRATTQDRLAVKTPEAAFLHVLRREFNFSPRVSRELLNTAKEMLVGGVPSSAVRPGQVRLVVTSLKAPFGPPLEETDKVEVTLTVDASAEDAGVGGRAKAEGLRQGRILRLTEEALEQGGILTQEDLARALVNASGGIVGDMLKKQIDDVNARHVALCAERDTLTAEIEAGALSDAQIAAMLTTFDKDVITGLQNATFEDKRRALEDLNARVYVDEGCGQAQVTCRIPLADRIIALGPLGWP